MSTWNVAFGFVVTTGPGVRAKFMNINDTFNLRMPSLKPPFSNPGSATAGYWFTEFEHSTMSSTVLSRLCFSRAAINTCRDSGQDERLSARQLILHCRLELRNIIICMSRLGMSLDLGTPPLRSYFLRSFIIASGNGVSLGHAVSGCSTSSSSKRKWLVSFKGGLVRLSKSAFTWSTMINTSSRVEKCTRKALMMPWERGIHLNTAVLTFANHECWPEGVEATPTKHGPQVGLGNI